MSYFQSFYKQAPVSGTDARQTKMFMDRLKNQEKERKEQAKALAEDQKRLGMIAQGMGLEKGEVDSMSRGELSGFIQNEMNQNQEAQVQQKFLMDMQKQQMDQQRVNNSTMMAQSQNKFADAQLAGVKAKETQRLAEVDQARKNVGSMSQVVDKFLKKPGLSSNQSDTGEVLQGMLKDPNMDPNMKLDMFEKFSPDMMGKPESKDPGVDYAPMMREAFKDMEEYRERGGEASEKVKIDEIRRIKGNLESGDVNTGELGDFMGEMYRKVFKEQDVSAQQAFELIMQKSLKQTLGAQFTENEAKQFFSRAYDPKLSSKQNVSKLQRFLTEMISKADYDIQRFKALSSAKSAKDYAQWTYDAEAPSNFQQSASSTTTGGNTGKVIDLGGGTQVQQIK